MKKTISTLISLLIFTSGLQSQDIHSTIPESKNRNPYQSGSFYYIKSITSTPYFNLKTGEESEIKEYLFSNTEDLKAIGCGLKLIFNKKSPGGNHFTYQQTYLDIPIYAATIKVNSDNNQHITSVFNALLPVTTIDEAKIKSQLTKLNQKKLITRFILNKFDSSVLFDHEINICFIDETNAVAVQKIKVWNRSKSINVLNLIDENGEIIYQKDLKTYFNAVAQDSLINVKVFNPDPLTVAGVSYGIPYKDNSDADAVIYDTVRFSSSMVASFDAGIFTLSNDFVSILDFDAPSKPVVTQTNPDFFYSRFDDGFEDVNAFYHITMMQTYVQSLGFNNIMNQVLELDSHGAGGSDNSFFTSSGSQPNIVMGEGGVDDAEDADVIVHEYGHALSWSANNNNFISSERYALDEAFGDYQSATYSRAINPFHWYEIFTWDGHNEFWSGRFANTTKIYPQDLTGFIHDDGEIWSSVMMEIWGLIGKTTTDKLHYESLYGWSDNMSMPDAALLVILADSALNNGANFPTLCDRFKARGLYSGSCLVSVPEVKPNSNGPMFLNTNGFASGSEDLHIVFPDFENTIQIQVFDMIGKEVRSFYESNTNMIKIAPNSIPSGLYEVVITTTTGVFISKVARLNTKN